MNLVGELIIGKSMLNRTLTEFESRHSKDPLRAKLAETLAFQSRVLDELHKCVLKIRMVPVEQLFRPIPARRSGRRQSLRKGHPLLKLPANTPISTKAFSMPSPNRSLTSCETPSIMASNPASERLSAGKPARGHRFSLNAYHQGTQVVIEIKDDGRGIDLDLVRQQAVRTGLLKDADAERPQRRRMS